MRKQNEKSVNIWLVWPIAIISLFILVFFGYSILKEMSKKKQLEEEIGSLKDQAEKIKSESMNLEERISYLGSKDYQEMQAKEKLNLKNPAENVVVIAEGPIKKEDNAGSIDEPAPNPVSVSIPNYQKWLNYFFE